MGAPRDWLGVRQGKLLIIRRMDRRSDGQAMWECRCDCGTLCAKSSGNLRQGVKSCSIPCGVSESNRHRARHGVARHKEWRAWTSAKQRCFNTNNPKYHHYGGRGITMCEEWVKSFPAFYAHIGAAPGTGRDVSLDRIDNALGYIPGNVRWTSSKVQLNNRRSTRADMVGGEKLSLSEISEKYGLPASTLDARWRRGLRGAALVAPRKRVLGPKVK